MSQRLEVAVTCRRHLLPVSLTDVPTMPQGASWANMAVPVPAFRTVFQPVGRRKREGEEWHTLSLLGYFVEVVLITSTCILSASYLSLRRP